LNNNNTQNYEQQRPMTKKEDIYLPEEPVLLTDYEEERLSEQIRTQLGNSSAVDRLKLFYQEIATYDSNVTNYVHYSNIQAVAYQLGVERNIFLFFSKNFNFFFSSIYKKIHFVLLCVNLSHQIVHVVLLIMKI
jgi:hypothetical protein